MIPCPEDIVIQRYDYTNPCLPRSINFYYDHYLGKPIIRCVAYLANSGCEWSEKSGGCTMCGTKNFSLHRRVKDNEYIAQLMLIDREIDRYHSTHPRTVEALHIYNDGIYFNDEEIGPGVREKIYELACSKHMKKLVIETSSGDIVRDHRAENYLGHAVARLGDTAFELSLGVESTNQTVRELYNKSDSIDDIRQALTIIRSNGALPKAYVLVKGPLLTEAEAMEDCTQTISTLFAWSIGQPMRIELQPVCLLPNTLHEYLRSLPDSDPYQWQPPLLSSVLEIISRFPYAGEQLYSTLFAPLDAAQAWEFWQTRPNDGPELTQILYKHLAEHYLFRQIDSISNGLTLASAELRRQRLSTVAPHSLSDRVPPIKQLLELAYQAKMHLSDFVRHNLKGEGNFLDRCNAYLQSRHS